MYCSISRSTVGSWAKQGLGIWNAFPSPHWFIPVLVAGIGPPGIDLGSHSQHQILPHRTTSSLFCPGRSDNDNFYSFVAIDNAYPLKIQSLIDQIQSSSLRNGKTGLARNVFSQALTGHSSYIVWYDCFHTFKLSKRTLRSVIRE